MSNHLKSKHREEFKLIGKSDKISKPVVAPEHAILRTSTSSTSAEKQVTLSESFERKLLRDVNDAKAKKYHFLIVEIIAIDNEPFSIVEKVGLKRLLEQALPRYELPSRTYISPKNHQVTIHVDKNNIGQYFDPFGRAPKGFHKAFLNRNCKIWYFNSKKIQNEWISVCGEDCLVYLHHMFYSQSMQNFVRIFDEDKTLCKDLIIDNLFKSYFK